MIHELMGPFFFVQVALEKAACSACEAGSSLISQHITGPLQRKAQEFVGTNSPQEIEKVKTDLESIRHELHALRSDLRELQQTTV